MLQLIQTELILPPYIFCFESNNLNKNAAWSIKYFDYTVFLIINVILNSN